MLSWHSKNVVKNIKKGSVVKNAPIGSKNPGESHFSFFIGENYLQNFIL